MTVPKLPEPIKTTYKRGKNKLTPIKNIIIEFEYDPESVKEGYRLLYEFWAELIWDSLFSKKDGKEAD